MAVINSVVIGRGRKSVGEVTLRNDRGRTIAAKRIIENKSRTPQQQARRNVFGYESQVMAQAAQFISDAFGKSRYGSPRNAFMKRTKPYFSNFVQEWAPSRTNKIMDIMKFLSAQYPQGSGQNIQWFDFWNPEILTYTYSEEMPMISPVQGEGPVYLVGSEFRYKNAYRSVILSVPESLTDVKAFDIILWHFYRDNPDSETAETPERGYIDRNTTYETFMSSPGEFEETGTNWAINLDPGDFYGFMNVADRTVPGFFLAIVRYNGRPLKSTFLLYDSPWPDSSVVAMGEACQPTLYSSSVKGNLHEVMQCNESEWVADGEEPCNCECEESEPRKSRKRKE